MGSVLEELSETIVHLLLQEPFYAHFFGALAREVGDRVPTMGVGRFGNSFCLLVNPHYWREGLTSRESRCAVLKHEILHLLLGHPLCLPEFSHADLFNVAADLVVNQHIEEADLPGGPVLLSSFPELRLENDMGVRHYYERLLPLYGQCLERLPRADPSEQGEQCPGPPEAENDDANESLRNLAAFLRRKWSEHAVWNDFENLGKAARAVLDEGLYRAMLRAKQAIPDRAFKQLPDCIRLRFQDQQQLRERHLDWRRILRAFGESSRRTYLKNTIRAPSRRYGTTPGIRVRRRSKLLVAIDTSGSVSERELQAFFLEIRHLYRQGAEITIVECDTTITNRYLYSGRTPAAVSGRGGTDFDAPIVYANEKLHPDAIVYFTDGMGGPPKARPRCPILWLISDFEENRRSHETLWAKFPGRIAGIRI